MIFQTDVSAMMPSSGYKTIPLKSSLNLLAPKFIKGHLRATHVTAHAGTRSSKKRTIHAKLKS